MKSLLIAEVVFIFSCFVFAVALFILIQESIRHLFNSKKAEGKKKSKRMNEQTSLHKKYVPIREVVRFKGPWN